MDIKTWARSVRLLGRGFYLVVAVWALSGCGGSPPAYRLPSGYHPGYTERGIASWYGPGFHGNSTANGERYNQDALTAAHRTLPLGSVVRVISLSNSRSVTVRINDRGPFVKGRIIDLSRAAAQYLGMIGKGTDEVEVRLQGYQGSRKAPGVLRVQVASLSEPANAKVLANRLRERYPDVRVVRVRLPDGVYYRVQAGQFTSERQAEVLANLIEGEYNVEALIFRDDIIK